MNNINPSLLYMHKNFGERGTPNLKQNNNKSGVACRNEKQPSVNYTVEDKTFIVNPVYKDSGENIRDILLKLMKTETQKS